MKDLNSIKRFTLMFFCSAFLVVCVDAKRAMSQTVWIACTWDTSSIYKQKDGREKFERRFYVTDLISTTKDVYVAVTKGVPGLENVCGDYLQRTVYKAAEERGERLESGTLKVLKNIEDSGEDIGSANRWAFAPKEQIEKKRAEMIKDAQDGGRVILSFNWDLSNNAEAADLAKEKQRVPSNIAVTTTPPTTKTEPTANSTSGAPANKGSAATKYIFGWARVVTTVQDLDKRYANSINRAYYSNVIALAPNADANALKGQVATYFNQAGVPYAMKVNEKVEVKDVTVKTFPTLYEADNARYASATQDQDKLNANATTDVALPVSYFTWNYYGSRHELFPDLADFATTGYTPAWEFVIFEVRAEKQINGQTVSETRSYVSYPFELFMTGSEGIKQKKVVDTYFTKTVVEPAAQRGVKISYYESDIDGLSTSYKTFAEAWAKRGEQIEVIKSREYPQYDFLLVSNGPNKGESTSFPFCALSCTGEHARLTSLEMQAATKK